MGTWNAKPFGNDAALDWLAQLDKANDESIIKQTLEAVTLSEVPLEAGKCEEAIATAAVVEAARRQPIGKLPKEAKAWVVEHGFVPSDLLIREAVAALQKIVKRSELNELWAEPASPNKWKKELEALQIRLRDAAALPRFERMPKPPSRLSIFALITKAGDEENDPLRVELRERLDKLTKLDAPLPNSPNRFPPVLHLAERGFIREAALLLHRGADIEAKAPGFLIAMTALERAAASKQPQMVQFLLSQGARLFQEIRLSSDSPPHKKGDTIHYSHALVYAVEMGDATSVEALLRHGADVHQNDLNGETLLHKAAANGGPDVVRLLAAKGLSCHATQCSGETPLHYAASHCHPSAVSVLLELGANPNANDNYGETPCDQVDDLESETATLLRSKGGVFH